MTEEGAIRRARALSVALETDIHAAVAGLVHFAGDFAVDRGLLYEAVLLSREVASSAGTPSADLSSRALDLTTRILRDHEENWDREDARARREAREQARAAALEMPVPNEVVFSASHLGKRYSRTGFSLEDVNLDLRFGTITGVVGLNGNGKTTLFRLIVGEISPTAGAMSFPAIKPGKVRWGRVWQQIAYVPQELPRWHGSLRTQLHYEAAVHGTLGRDNEREVDFIIERLGLTDELEKRWTELAGGFKLRFSLARALVWKPKLLVLDEPLANLDFLAQRVVLKDLRHLTNSLRYPLAVLISSQHLHEVEAVSDDILFLNRGRVEYSGRTDDIGENRQQNSFELGGRALSLAQLHSVLNGTDYLSIEHSGVSFIVETRTTITASALLRTLLDGGVDLDYFCDNSRGVKSLFAKGAPES